MEEQKPKEVILIIEYVTPPATKQNIPASETPIISERKLFEPVLSDSRVECDPECLGKINPDIVKKTLYCGQVGTVECPGKYRCVLQIDPFQTKTFVNYGITRTELIYKQKM